MTSKELVSTPFGYGEIESLAVITQPQTVSPEVKPEEQVATPALGEPIIKKVAFKWGGIGYLEESTIKKTVNLKIKTFFESRRLIDIEVAPKSTIGEILTEISKVIGVEVYQTLSNPRLFYPMGSIQHLTAVTKSVADYCISPGATIIMMAQSSASSPKWKSSDILAGTQVRVNLIQVINGGLGCQVDKYPEGQREVNISNVLACTSYSSGRHYWAMKITANSSDSNLTVGVCNSSFDKESIPEYGNFWGISPFTATKIGPNQTDSYEQGAFKNGDKLGLLLEFKNQLATLRFSLNDNPLEVEFEGLAGPLFPVVSFMSTIGSVTLLPGTKPPAGM